MQGTPEGEFSDLQWKPDALKGKGGWQIVGPYYIHQGNGNVFNKDVMGNNGCIAICTVLDSKYGAAFKDFQGTLQKFSGTTDFYLMKINLQVVKAETPSIIEE